MVFYTHHARTENYTGQTFRDMPAISLEMNRDWEWGWDGTLLTKRNKSETKSNHYFDHVVLAEMLL